MSEYTTVDLMFISLQVLRILRAISPRFAISILFIFIDLNIQS